MKSQTLIRLAFAITLGLTLGFFVKTKMASGETSQSNTAANSSSLLSIDKAPKKMVASEAPAASDKDLSSLPSDKTAVLLRTLPTLTHASSEELLTFCLKNDYGVLFQEKILEHWARRYPLQMLDTILTDPKVPRSHQEEWARYAINQCVLQHQDELIARLDQLSRKPAFNGLRSMTARAVSSCKGDFALTMKLEARWQVVAQEFHNPKFARWLSQNQKTALTLTANLSGNARYQYSYQLGKLAADLPKDLLIERTSQIKDKKQLEYFSEGFMSELSKDSPQEALAFLSENFPSRIFATAASPAISKLFKIDAASAISWVQSHITDDRQRNLISSTMHYHAMDDWPAAKLTLNAVPQGELRNAAAKGLMDGISNRIQNGSPYDETELEGWIINLSDNEARNQIINHNSFVRDLPSLAKKLASLPDPELAGLQLIQSVASRLYYTDSSEAKKWITSLPKRNRIVAEKHLKALDPSFLQVE